MKDDEQQLIATRRVLNFANRAHNVHYELIAVLSGGYQSGAFLIGGPLADEAVLKWSHNKAWARQVQRAAPLIPFARVAGWPTPAWLVHGVTPSGYLYQIQERAVGKVAQRLDRALALAALRLFEQQRGMRPETDQDWSSYDRKVVFTNDSEIQARLAASSPAGERFIAVLRSVTEPYRKTNLPDTDLVHGDFNPSNILMADDAITAVIDVEAIGKGSRFHDLATLISFGILWQGDNEAISILLQYALEFALPGELEVTLASRRFDCDSFMETAPRGKNLDSAAR